MNYPIDAQCSLNKLRRKGARYFTFYKIISNAMHNLHGTFRSNVNKLTSLLGALISIEYLDDAIL